MTYTYAIAKLQELDLAVRDLFATAAQSGLAASKERNKLDDCIGQLQALQFELRSAQSEAAMHTASKAAQMGSVTPAMRMTALHLASGGRSVDLSNESSAHIAADAEEQAILDDIAKLR